MADGGGKRHNSGKAPVHLLPPMPLKATAEVWGFGAQKYESWNWARGMPWSVPYACAMRHLMAWYEGEDLDPESGLPHLDHVACNIMMLQQYRETYKEGDDRPELLRKSQFANPE